MSRRRILPALLVAVVLGLTWSSEVRLERLSGEGPGEELLYLPNGKLLKVMSLGNAPLAADAVYLWAIQYYSNYERRDRYRYVEHVFDRVITELDPHYIDAYWLGALILSIEAGDLDAALRLLDKGAANNPDSWILPYLAAWECYHHGQYERAAGYFARAARVPGAPATVVRMRAGMFSKAGDLGEAVSVWRELLEDPASDAATVSIARRQLRELQVRLDVSRLTAAVDRFRSENGRNPARLEELRARGYIDALPRDPDGRDYRYDPRKGRISSATGRVLGGS